MKKLIPVILLLTVLFCACSGKDSATLPSQSAAQTEPSQTATEKPVLDGGDLLTLGTVNGATYENTALGYGCTLDDGWTYADEARIAQLNNLTQTILNDDAKKMLSESPTFMDMYAEKDGGAQNINVQFMNTKKSFGLAEVEAETVIEASMASLQPALESMGYTNVELERTSVTIDGDELPAILIIGDLNGVRLYQKEFCVKADSYMVFVCVTARSTAEVDETLTHFYKLG